MHMSVWLGYDLQDFIFDGLTVSTILAFVFTNIIVFMLAVFFEASKILLAHSKKTATKACLILNKRDGQRRRLRQTHETNGAEPGPSRTQDELPIMPQKTIGKRCFLQLTPTVMHMCHNILGYFLMLAVMLYNAFLIIAVILGLMVGYFVFGPKLMQYQMGCGKTQPVCTRECDENAEGTSITVLESADASSRTQLFSCETPGCSGYSTPPVPCRFGAERCPAKVARLTPERRIADEGSAACCQTRVAVQVEQVKENLLQFNAAPVCCKSKISNESEKEVLIDKNGKSETSTCCKSKTSTLGEAKEKLLNLNIVKSGNVGSETEVLIEKEAKDTSECCASKKDDLVNLNKREIEDEIVSADKRDCRSKNNMEYEKGEWKEESSGGES